MNKNLFKMSYSVRKEFHRKVAFFIFFVLCIFIFINIVFSFLVFPVRTCSVSMEPDLDENSCILFSPLKRNVHRGDVVLCGPLLKDESSVSLKVADCFVRFFTAQQLSFVSGRKNMGTNCFVRRVVGLPGDSIYMRDYVVYIKPAGGSYFLTEFELVKKPYNVSIAAAPALWDSSIGVEGSFDEITLSENEYFVLGDHRNSCVDSRFFGSLEESEIKAGALFSYFPFDKLRLYF